MKVSARKSTGAAGHAGDAGAACVCRVCLRPCVAGERCPLFTTWSPPLHPACAAICIGERLAQLAGVEMREDDGYPQAICAGCLSTFKETHLLLCAAQRSDRALRSTAARQAPDPRLPGPIRFDPTAVNAAPAEAAARRRAPRKRGAPDMEATKVAEEVKVKEEVMSEEETTEAPLAEPRVNPNVYIKPEPDSEPELDIKIEPEELLAQHRSSEHLNCPKDSQPPVSNFIITGTYSMDPGQRASDDEELAQSPGAVIKEELDEDVDSDVPLDCMLCHKSFQTVSGLKAHVITSHSYKSVLRKRLNGRVADTAAGLAEANLKSPLEQLACITCSKTFSTAASLRLHEAVHDTGCARCGERFTTFVLRARHAGACAGRRASPAHLPSPPAPPAARRTRTVRQLKREYTAEPSKPQSNKKKKFSAKQIGPKKSVNLQPSKEQALKSKEKRLTTESKNTSKTPVKTGRQGSKNHIEHLIKENVQALLSQITNPNDNAKEKNGPDIPNDIVPSETTPVVSVRSTTEKNTESKKGKNNVVYDLKENHERPDTIPETLNIKVEKKYSNSDIVSSGLKENGEAAETILENTVKIELEQFDKNLPTVENIHNIDDPVKILDEAKSMDNVFEDTNIVDVDIKNKALLATSTKIIKDNSRLFISIDPLPVVSALGNQVIGDV